MGVVYALRNWCGARDSGVSERTEQRAVSVTELHLVPRGVIAFEWDALVNTKAHEFTTGHQQVLG